MKAIKKWTLVLASILLIVFISACTVAPIETLPPSLGEPISTQEATAEPTAESTAPPFSETFSLVALALGNTSDSPLAAGIPVEYDFWSKVSGSFQDPSAPPTMTVTFNGKSYTGAYISSHILPPNTFQGDKYYTDGECLFTVNAKTGELTGFIPMDINSLEEGDKTVEERRDAACTFAEQFGDLSQFQITQLSDDPTTTFYFVRYIDNMKTAESFSVDVYPSGRIRGFSGMMLGCFESETSTLSTNMASSIELLASQKAADVLDVKMQDIYATIKKPANANTFSYEIKDSWLLPLPDGTMGTLYNMRMCLHNAAGEAMDSFLIKVLIKCEPSSEHEVS